MAESEAASEWLSELAGSEGHSLTHSHRALVGLTTPRTGAECGVYPALCAPAQRSGARVSPPLPTHSLPLTHSLTAHCSVSKNNVASHRLATNRLSDDRRVTFTRPLPSPTTPSFISLISYVSKCQLTCSNIHALPPTHCRSVAALCSGPRCSISRISVK